MNVTNISLTNYRNLRHLQLSPIDTVNVIYGDNAQGKTNIIEAIWICSGMPSFRGAKTNELISFNKQEDGSRQNFSRIKIDFRDFQRDQTIELVIGEERKILINGVPYKNNKELLNRFFVVVFSPEHLSFFKDGPKIRRKFLDDAVSQIKTGYAKYLDDYGKLITQRNALIKDYRRYDNLSTLLEVWDYQIAKIGTIIEIYRFEYIKNLNKITKQIYNNLTSSVENLSVDFISNVFDTPIYEYDQEHVDNYFLKLQQSIPQDKQVGYTSVGSHRSDIRVRINDIDTQTYGSQGQQRSSVITIKLAEAKIIELATGQTPVILLDDVMSELDEKRQEYILNHVKKSQVFITCCDYNNITNLKQGKVFLINKGKLAYDSEVNR